MSKRQPNTIIANTITNAENLDVLQKTVLIVLTKRKITFEEFSKWCFASLLDRDFSRYQLISRRNDFVKMLTCRINFSFNAFKFVMGEVLKEPIPDDPEIKRLYDTNKKSTEDLSGDIFGRLIVIRYAGRTGSENRRSWVCRCECGLEIIVFGKSLINGNTRSCGCYKRDITSDRRKTHGMSSSDEYNIWLSMKQRCNNSNNHDYSSYGDRGIKVCERWLESFENFYADMGPRPPGKSLDRKDNDGEYHPDNCRWATWIEQANNRRNTIFVDKIPLSQWAEDNGVKYDAANNNYHKGVFEK